MIQSNLYLLSVQKMWPIRCEGSSVDCEFIWRTAIFRSRNRRSRQRLPQPKTKKCYLRRGFWALRIFCFVFWSDLRLPLSTITDRIQSYRPDNRYDPAQQPSRQTL